MRTSNTDPMFERDLLMRVPQRSEDVSEHPVSLGRALGRYKAPLFERVCRERVQTYSVKDWQEEIGRSLSHLFNTHQGSTLSVQDYGLPVLEPEELTLRKLKAYENEIRSLIQKYEPRFKKVEVKGQFDEAHKSRVIFNIAGQIDESLSGGRVSYRSVMMENGQMIMRI